MQDAAQGVASSPKEGKEPLTLLVLVGLPGSGKTTFATALVDASYSAAWPVTRRQWTRASQDDAPGKKRAEAENVARAALVRGENVVVDRVDFDPDQRAHFITLGRSLPFPVQILCLNLAVAHSVLTSRLSTRENHPTLPTPDKALDVLRRLSRAFVPPHPSEGFDRVFTLDGRAQPGYWGCDEVLRVLERVEREGRVDDGSQPRQRQHGRGRGGYSSADRGRPRAYGAGGGQAYVPQQGYGPPRGWRPMGGPAGLPQRPPAWANGSAGASPAVPRTPAWGGQHAWTGAIAGGAGLPPRPQQTYSDRPAYNPPLTGTGAASQQRGSR